MPRKPCPYKLLVGKIAFRVFRDNNQSVLADTTSTGGTHALDGFEPEEILGFALALKEDTNTAARCEIKLHALTFQDYDVPEEYISTDGTVKIRSFDGDRINIIPLLQASTKNSFAHTDKTDTAAITSDKAIEDHWLPVIIEHLGDNPITENTAKTFLALAKGVVRNGETRISQAVEFLAETADKIPKSGSVTSAAGSSLPILGFPLFELCFASIRADKINNPKAWQDVIKKHSQNRCYIKKQDAKYQHLSAEELRKKHKAATDIDAPPIKQETIDAFEKYIDAPHGESPESRALLFEHDWRDLRSFFESSKNKVSSSLSVRTRTTLAGAGVTLSNDDEQTLDSITKSKKKSDINKDEAKKFFETHAEAINEDPKLYADWQKLVHGERITGDNLLAMIVDSFKLANLEGEASDYRIVLEGIRQGGATSKLNALKKFNPDACLAFAHAYKSLPSLTNGLVSFRNSLVANYLEPKSQDYLAKIKPKRTTSLRANSVEFNLIIESGTSKNPKVCDKRPITWTFNPGSVIVQQYHDFRRIAKFIAESPKTALIRNKGHYERVGPKGTTPILSLNDVYGFNDDFGAGGKGSFVPARKYAKENSILKTWEDCIKAAKVEGVNSARIEAINSLFMKFKTSYEALLSKLADDLLTQDGIPVMVNDYRELLEALPDFHPERFRNDLTRIVLGIGNADIPRSGRRPAVSIICPWHPLRIEAAAARAQQFVKIIQELLSPTRPNYSDERGDLFFKECATAFDQPLYPEISTYKDSSQLRLRKVAEFCAGYSLHLPVEPEENTMEVLPDSSKRSAAIIYTQIQEYLRLQPHERDNLSVALYNCSSPSLANELVSVIEKHNRDHPEDEITCLIHLMHREPEVLRDVYQKLVTSGIGAYGDGPAEATGDLLSRIRVNIAAANTLQLTERGEPVDIVYCKDAITSIVNRSGGIKWRKQKRENREPVDLFPHRWSYKLPVEYGAKRTFSLMSCPAMTAAGWSHMNTIASLMTTDSQEVWNKNECMLPVNMLNFEDKEIEKVFEETHKIGTWVINEDDLLERKLLEDNRIKVIRYIQSCTHGRNLIISSTSKETLLRNTLRSRLQQILPGTPESNRLSALATRFIDDANQISGGLFLRSARRAKNTGELIGMVLSRFIVQQETLTRPTAWCFLDDYAQWLGKKAESQIADLLVLSWDAGGKTPVLDVVVTEAKFVNGDIADDKAKESAVQLRHTLAQLEEALIGEKAPLDQRIWLARLSNLFLNRVVFTGGAGDNDPTKWANMIRERQCHVRIRGYSHVFVYSPEDAPIRDSTKIAKTTNGIQEIFSPAAVRSLIQIYENNATMDELALKSSLKQVRTTYLLESIQSEPKVITEPSEVVLPTIPTSPPNSDEENRGGDDGGNDSPGPINSKPAGTQTTTQPGKPFAGNDVGPEPIVAVDQTEQKPDAPYAGQLLDYLAARSSAFTYSQDEGLAWLKFIDGKLKTAFLNRQLPYVHAEGCEPILTPNAGIIRLRGKDNLTVPIVQSKVSAILTTEAIEIISIDPEPGRIRITILRPQRQILHTEPVLYDFLCKNAGDAAKERIVVGVKEEDGKPLLLDPFEQPHTLIAGSTGSGKSVLMQNLILSVAATRPPSESKIFLIDPKSGVDYMTLQSLPHIMAGSGGVIDTQNASLECFAEAVEEMEKRLQLMKKASIELKKGIPNILAYREHTGEPMPTWWMIHDEFADWMQTEPYNKEIPELVNRLGVKARAAGIFLVFAAQRPDKDVFPMQLRAQLLNRLVLKVDGSGTSEISLGDKITTASQLLGKGHMLAKVAGYSAPVFTQVPYIDPATDLPNLVNVITAHYGHAK
jgi:DNA segregation ATPase FtsK/SpoIIIE, S-DNA-T family